MARKPLTQQERDFMHKLAAMFGEVRSHGTDTAEQKKELVDKAHSNMNFLDPEMARAAIGKYAVAIYKDLTGYMTLSLNIPAPEGNPKDRILQEKFNQDVYRELEHHAQVLPADYREKETTKIKNYVRMRNELIQLAREASIELPEPEQKPAMPAVTRNDAVKFMTGTLSPEFAANQNDTFKKERDRKLNVIATLYAIIYEKTPGDQLARVAKEHFRVMSNTTDLADAQRQINNLTIPLHARLYSKLKKMREDLHPDQNTVAPEKIVVVPAGPRQLQKYVRQLQHALFEQPDKMLKFAAFAEALQIVERIAPEVGVTLITPKRRPTPKTPKSTGPKNRR